jgi:DNA-binding response OmpR family regulator
VLAGYRAGARLCLTRPIRGDVLAAHLRALLAPLEPRAFRLGQLSFDPARKRLTFPDGAVVPLPPLELQLLLSLARSMGSPVPHKRLMDDVWPTGDQPSVMNGLYVVAGRLRKLLGPFGWMVRAVRRSGYMLTVERRLLKEEVPIDRRVRARHRR